MGDKEREEGKSLTVRSFYGAKNIRKCIGIQRSLDNTVKKHETEKIPKPFPNRIVGPCTKWQTFYRQQDAFMACHSVDRDLHVFAFESECFEGNTGQRMYLVASYPVFWHYYEQMEQEKRHHYEIIPEGAVCKLYFDLEYDKIVNPHRDGNTMVDILIKIMCTALEKEFSLKLSRSDVLDLEASTEKKFSRHLIFQSKNTVFRNNVHAGNFVSCVMTAILGRLNKLEKKPSHDVHQTTQDIGEQSLESTNTSDEKQTQSEVADKDTDGKKMVNSLNNTDSHSCDKTHTGMDVESTANSSCGAAANGSSDSVLSTDNGSKDTEGIHQGFVEMLKGFSDDDLREMIVKNKHGEEVLFCDTGVYTKNRNFRLYFSSKMNKNNSLGVSAQNRYRPKAMSSPNSKHTSDEEAIFFDSLIANVTYNQSTRVLTFGNDTDKQFSLGRGHSSKVKDKESIDGYNRSPYPEVDEYITSLIKQNGIKGAIRHWTYFHLGELLLYEISHYRFCHNIGRPHRSNNIMYVVDLRKGVFYQKCHDPDCNLRNYRSDEWPLPREVLPEFYFTSDMDDVEDQEMDDEQLLNTTLELEKHCRSTANATNNRTGSSQLEDGNDELLLNAVVEMETGSS